MLVARKSFINETGISQGHVQNGPPRDLYNCCGISWYHVSLYWFIQLWRLHKTQNSTLMTLNQYMKKISKWNTSLS